MTKSKWAVNSYYLTGFLGVLIYGLLFLYSFQFILSFLFKKKSKVKYFNYKISFHFIFSLCSIFEVIYYSSYMISERSLFLLVLLLFLLLDSLILILSFSISFFFIRTTAWGYSFHLVAIFLSVVYYGMVNKKLSLFNFFDLSYF